MNADRPHDRTENRDEGGFQRGASFLVVVAPSLVELKPPELPLPARRVKRADNGESAGKGRFTMTDQKQELQDNGTAGKDGNEPKDIEAKQQRTFTTDEVTEIVRRRLEQQQRKFDAEKAEMRETLTANIERAQHLEHDKRQVDKHREELEELREYKANRERNDLLSRISQEFGGVPIELLHGETAEELEESARAIRGYADTFKPQVPETRAAGATPAPDNVGGKASILGIKDRRERLKAIAENRELFDSKRSDIEHRQRMDERFGDFDMEL